MTFFSLQDLSPAGLLLFLLATVCASLAHILWGHRWLQILIFWLAAMIGCFLVYLLNLRLPLGLASPAGVPVLEAVIFAWLLIIAVSRLGGPKNSAFK